MVTSLFAPAAKLQARSRMEATCLQATEGCKTVSTMCNADVAGACRALGWPVANVHTRNLHLASPTPVCPPVALSPVGHNGCMQCMASVQRRKPECPLCRAAFPAAGPLTVNVELRDLIALAATLHTVEEPDGWQTLAAVKVLAAAGSVSGLPNQGALCMDVRQRPVLLGPTGVAAAQLWNASWAARYRCLPPHQQCPLGHSGIWGDAAPAPARRPSRGRGRRGTTPTPAPRAVTPPPPWRWCPPRRRCTATWRRCWLDRATCCRWSPPPGCPTATRATAPPAASPSGAGRKSRLRLWRTRYHSALLSLEPPEWVPGSHSGDCTACRRPFRCRGCASSRTASLGMSLCCCHC
jgi:hypothetical protein